MNIWKINKMNMFLKIVQIKNLEDFNRMKIEISFQIS
jgi:hypothetical protein